MAAKTISIDVEAYERLKSVQKPTESLSQTIKRVVRRRYRGERRWDGPIDLKAWFAAMDGATSSQEAVDAVARHLKARHRR